MAGLIWLAPISTVARERFRGRVIFGARWRMGVELEGVLEDRGRGVGRGGEGEESDVISGFL